MDSCKIAYRTTYHSLIYPQLVSIVYEQTMSLDKGFHGLLVLKSSCVLAFLAQGGRSTTVSFKSPASLVW